MKTQLKMQIITTLILALLLIAPSIYSEETYRYEPSVVSVTGKLVEKVFYGPPGYGENPKTDTKEHTVILLLNHPIRVVAEKDDQFNETRGNVKEVQLINVKEIALSTYIQKKVKVTGKLSSAITGHHHTDVLMEIDNIQVQE
jgi:hypothetical protein